MQISNNNVTFESKIKFIDSKSFQTKIKNLNPKRHEVGYPWTPDTMKRGKNLYTTQIMDCIAGGIIDNGEITMFHLCTRSQAQAKRTRQKGFSIKEFQRRISEKVNLNNENLHGFILGGFQLEPTSKYNVNKLNKITKYFNENNIPCSVFGARRDVHYFGKYSMFYENQTDTLYITNSLTNSSSLNGKGLEIEVKNDSVAYNTYTKNKTSVGPLYKKERKETNVNDFFKSQFRQVYLSKFDEYA